MEDKNFLTDFYGDQSLLREELGKWMSKQLRGKTAMSKALGVHHVTMDRFITGVHKLDFKSYRRIEEYLVEFSDKVL